MNKLLILGMAAVLLAFACAAPAYPTLAGPTGLVLVPTVYVVAPGTASFAVDYLAPVTGNSGKTEKGIYPIRVLYGVTRGVECGAAYDPDAIRGKDLWNVNAKYMLPYHCDGLRTAIGALYGQTGNGNAPQLLDSLHGLNPTMTPTTGGTVDVTQVYLVGTDNLRLGNFPFELTVGANWTEANAATTGNVWRGMLGFDAPICRKLDLVADLQTNAKNQGVLQSGTDLCSGELRYACSPNTLIGVGGTNGYGF